MCWRQVRGWIFAVLCSIMVMHEFQKIAGDGEWRQGWCQHRIPRSEALPASAQAALMLVWVAKSSLEPNFYSESTGRNGLMGKETISWDGWEWMHFQLLGKAEQELQNSTEPCPGWCWAAKRSQPFKDGLKLWREWGSNEVSGCNIADFVGI